MAESRYHGPTTIDALCDWAAERLRRRDWVFIGVFGEPGFFKSSTVLQMARRIQPGFDVRRQVVFSDSEYEVARRITPPGGVIIRDEAIKSGSNRMRFMSRENNATVEDVNTGRKLYHAVFEIMPFADDEDPRLVKHMHWTLRFTGKGVGTAYECRRVGFKKVRLWEEPRIPFKRLHCAQTDPDLWAQYESISAADVRGNHRDTLARQERIDGHRAVARRLLRQLGIPLDPSRGNAI